MGDGIFMRKKTKIFNSEKKRKKENREKHKKTRTQALKEGIIRRRIGDWIIKRGKNIGKKHRKKKTYIL